MNYIKKIGMSLLYTFGIIIIMTFLITLFNYIGIFNKTVTSIFKIIIPLVATFIGGIITGKRSQQKGWLEGLRLGLIIVVIILLFSYLGLNYKLNLKNIIYYFIILVSTTFGSMIGVNKHEVDNN